MLEHANMHEKNLEQSFFETFESENADAQLDYSMLLEQMQGILSMPSAPSASSFVGLMNGNDTDDCKWGDELCAIIEEDDEDAFEEEDDVRMVQDIDLDNYDDNEGSEEDSIAGSFSDVDDDLNDDNGYENDDNDLEEKGENGLTHTQKVRNVMDAFYQDPSPRTRTSVDTNYITPTNDNNDMNSDSECRPSSRATDRVSTASSRKTTVPMMVYYDKHAQSKRYNNNDSTNNDTNSSSIDNYYSYEKDAWDNVEMDDLSVTSDNMFKKVSDPAPTSNNNQEKYIPYTRWQLEKSPYDNNNINNNEVGMMDYQSEAKSSIRAHAETHDKLIHEMQDIITSQGGVEQDQEELLVSADGHVMRVYVGQSSDINDLLQYSAEIAAKDALIDQIRTRELRVSRVFPVLF